MNANEKSNSFSDPDVQRCPFPAYEKLRPVYLDPGNGWYIVTDYELVREISNDSETYSSMTGQLLVQDSPQQAKIDAVFESEVYLPINFLVVSDPPAINWRAASYELQFTSY